MDPVSETDHDSRFRMNKTLEQQTRCPLHKRDGGFIYEIHDHIRTPMCGLTRMMGIEPKMVNVSKMSLIAIGLARQVPFETPSR